MHLKCSPAGGALAFMVIRKDRWSPTRRDAALVLVFDIPTGFAIVTTALTAFTHPTGEGTTQVPPGLGFLLLNLDVTPFVYRP